MIKWPTGGDWVSYSFKADKHKLAYMDSSHNMGWNMRNDRDHFAARAIDTRAFSSSLQRLTKCAAQYCSFVSELALVCFCFRSSDRARLGSQFRVRIHTAQR